MQNLGEDLRNAMRVLLKHPGFTLVVLLTLSLGIGANTAIFSVINAVLLRPLPFREPDRIVTVWERDPKGGYEQNMASPANFDDWRSLSQSFQEMAAYDTVLKSWFNITGTADAERVAGAAVSANLFNLLGVRPVLGRAFVPEEEKVGRNQIVIISYGLWQRRFASDTNIIGKPVLLNGKSHVVAGVMPQGFRFPGMTGVLGGFFYNKPADLWVPLALDGAAWRERGNHYLQVVGRLKPGVTAERAEAEMVAIQQRLVQQHSDALMGSHVKVIPLHNQSVAAVRSGLIVLFASAGLVLLIACSNVGNLLLTRAVSRQKEIAVRIALGASRSQLIQHVLAESTLLGIGGGLLGFIVAMWGLKLLIAETGGNLVAATYGWDNIRFDLPVYLFTLACSAVTGILFGLVPALQCTKPNVDQALKEGGRSFTSPGQNRMLRVLAASQIALAMVLLCAAGLMIRSFIRLQSVDPGFNPKNVLTAEISLLSSKYRNPFRQAAFYREAVERVQALPGIEEVGTVTQLPLSGESVNQAFEVIGRPPGMRGEMETADYRAVSPGFFKAMQIPLRKGRTFTVNDNTNTPVVAVVSESFVARYLSNQDPIGTRIKMMDRPIEIVGVVGEVRNRALDNAYPHIYFSYAQIPFWSTMTLVMRTSLDPASLTSSVRKEILAMDKDQPVSKIATMESHIERSIAQPRFRMLLISLFAGVALILALLGIFGVMSYITTQRTHEFGIRLALGAKSKQLLGMVLRQGSLLAGAGTIVGSFGALAAARLLSNLIFEFRMQDALIFVVVALFLNIAALLACYFPARRAAKVDPLVALRY